MPEANDCLVEEDAIRRALEEKEQFSREADEALLDYMDALDDVKECEDVIGPKPPDIIHETDPDVPAMDPMDMHELERLWEEYREKLCECTNSCNVEEKWNDYENLVAACEIAQEEADAAKEALEVCRHAPN